MKIYNTLTRKKEEFVPLQEGKALIYACGPTVYNFIHIGNARPICVFDTLRRYLEYRGYDVRFVQNFTDIDDKLINRANEEGTTVAQIAEKYIAEYKTDAKGLNVRPATVHPRATDSIAPILELIDELVDKGYAYESGGDVYFRTKKFGEYGKLSHMPLEDLEAGARISVGEQKEDPMDFCLWKSAKPGEPFWPSRYSDGRPGWHIECSAMAKTHLGETIDIHCGGQDLIFPHHENEIAQSECANGCHFARYWMHNGYINIDNRKMSKSLGNFFTVREIAEQYGYEPIRYLMISAHYRSPINYSTEVIEQCISALDRLYTCRENLNFALKNAASGTVDPAAEQIVAEKRAKFIEAMDDDLNTADAISVLFELAKEINIRATGENLATKETLELMGGLFDELSGVLGLLYDRKGSDLDEEVEALIAKRQEARKNKDFATADAIRDQLSEMGIVLKDTPQGVQWSRK